MMLVLSERSMFHYSRFSLIISITNKIVLYQVGIPILTDKLE